MARFIRSHRARKNYLDELSLGSSDTLAATAGGGTLAQFRAWRKADENFQRDYEDAVFSGTDFIEDVALQRALHRSDTLMVMMLKARRPDKYDRGSKLELSGGISVEGSRSKLLNKVARLQAQGGVSPEGKDDVAGLLEDESNKDQETKLLPPPDTYGPSRGSKRRAAAEGSGRAKAA